MFENKDAVIAAMRKPLTIAKMALDELQNRMGGTKIIADPNSPFCHLLEFSSTMAAMCAQTMDEKIPLLYPARAQSMSDLYLHMSDFDYLKMYASPSQAVLRIAFPKKYLADNASPYNENYKKVTIPKDTVILVGRYPFGIYYPIDILINNFTQTFTVVYDTSETNPLHALTKNVVDKYEYTYHAVDYIVIDIPIYQFAKSIVKESLIPETGFAKKILYNDYFYATRIFSYKDGKYTELGQSQSKYVYDVDNPTALVRVLPDEQKLHIIIPQIYLDKGMLGSQIYIEMYTTLGPLDVDTQSITSSQIQINFSKKTKDSTDYNAIFKNLPFDLMRILRSPKITGGSLPIDVSELRKRVVNNTLYDTVPIKDSDIQNYLNDHNFLVKKYTDNVTDRIYYAYRVMEDGAGAVIPSISLSMKMLADYYEDHPSFLLQSDRSITILPTTMYTYDTDSNSVVPLDAAGMARIGAMDKAQLCNELNNTQYLKNPFHIWVNLTDYYPEAISFNLMSPEVKKIIFEAENYNVSAKMVSFDATIEHLADGVGGYRVTLYVYRSDDILNAPAEYIHIFAVTKTTSEYWISTPVTYVETNNNVDTYQFDIQTNYHLTADDRIGVTNLQGDNITLMEHMIKLEQNFHIVYMVDPTILTGTWESASQLITQGVPSSNQQGLVGLSRQYLTLSLGYSLKDVLNNNIEVSATPLKYGVWERDILDVYAEDVYKRDEAGKFITEIVDGKVQLIKEHSRGDIKVNEWGQEIYKHRKGDVKITSNGPVIDLNRDKLYYLDLILIDAKVFASERTAEMDFVASMYKVMEGYFDLLRQLQDQLLERTEIYFRCVRSTGTAEMNIGDNVVVNQSIEMSFSVVCYVPSYVKQDETIQAIITKKTCEVIEEKIKTNVVSMADIFDSVQEQLADYIDHFTLLGINGQTTNQTFEILSEDAQPSIRRVLVLSEDNILSLQPSVEIIYKTLEDHTAGVTQYSLG